MTRLRSPHLYLTLLLLLSLLLTLTPHINAIETESSITQTKPTEAPSLAAGESEVIAPIAESEQQANVASERIDAQEQQIEEGGGSVTEEEAEEVGEQTTSTPIRTEPTLIDQQTPPPSTIGGEGPPTHVPSREEVDGKAAEEEEDKEAEIATLIANRANEEAGQVSVRVEGQSNVTSSEAEDEAGTALHSPIVDAGTGVCPRNCSSHGQCMTDPNNPKSFCVCDSGWEDNDCNLASSPGSTGLPSFWSVLFLILGVIAIERIYHMYKKHCTNTHGFSQVNSGGLDDQMDMEEFADQKMNDRL